MNALTILPYTNLLSFSDHYTLQLNCSLLSKDNPLSMLSFLCGNNPGKIPKGNDTDLLFLGRSDTDVSLGAYSSSSDLSFNYDQLYSIVACGQDSVTNLFFYSEPLQFYLTKSSADALSLGVDSTSSNQAAAGYIYFGRFTCLQSGQITSGSLYSIISGDVRIGIYDDDGGNSARTLLWESPVISVGGGQKNLFTVSSGPSLFKDTIYHIGMQGSVGGAFSYFSGPGGYQAYSFSAFPAAATESSQETSVCCCFNYAGASAILDLRARSTELAVGAGHTTLFDTINRLFLIGHNPDGSHK